METARQTHSTMMVLLLPLLYVLIPRPDIPGIQFVIYPLIAVVLGFVTFYFILKNGVYKATSTTLFMLMSLLGCISLSILISSTDPYALSHLAKIMLFTVVFLFGLNVGFLRSKETIYRGLLRSAYIVLSIQLIVGLTQLIANPIFGSLYSMEKTRPLGEIVRIAGTLGNPNIFAWIVIQMTAIIFIFEPRKIKKLVWIGLALGLVFLSGSRSMFMLFPAAMVAIYFMSSKKTPAFILVKLPFYLGSIGLFVVLGYRFLKANAVNFPYMSQLLMIFERGGLENINSFHARTLMWNDAMSQMEQGSIFTWLFGMGPGSIEVLDNDYLYSLVNYGLVFTVINLSLYVLFIYYFVKTRNKKLMTLGVQYILFSLIVGHQAESLSGWNYPILIMFYAGIAVAFYKRRGEPGMKEEPILRKRRRKYRITW